ncbi:hypothetical protein K1719_041946 [Acacia pycnantha]|nr:hypothetical protein K1719_041946 [Acacia pycnantha]
MAEVEIVPAVGASIVHPIASIVHHGLRKLRSRAGISTTSFKDIHKALNDELEWLVALQMDTDREVSRDVLKDKTDVYLLWLDSVSSIEEEVAFLNEKYYRLMRKKWRIWKNWKKRHLKKKNKRVLKKVIKLVEECLEKILEDKTEQVIKESGVPSFEEYPTLKKVLREIQNLLQSKAVKCVALHGQEGVGETIVMQNLNDYFYDSPNDKEFDVVIFIKVPTDEKTDLQILQKIAERMKVDGEGDESEVAGRIQRVLEDRRYLLILDGVRHPPDGIWEKLDISNHKKDIKVVIATHYPPLALKSRCVDRKVKLESLSPDEVWKMFQDIVGDKTSQLASPREGESSSKSTTPSGKLDQLLQYMLSLMRIWSFSHLILSYPLRIGHEEFLKQWMNNVYKLCFADGDGGANIDSLRTRVRHLISESPLRYVQAVIPDDITKDIINGGSVSMETPFEDMPGPIQFLANHLALHQLTDTLTSRTIPHSQLALDEIQNIWFSISDDAEKQTVVKNIQENSRIRSAFDHLHIIDLSQIGDEAQRELELSSLKTSLDQTTRAESLANHDRRSRHLVLVVDGNGDKKLDPQKLSLPIKRDSEDVVVFITTLSSDDELSKKVDLTIKTEDHLLPWELFCNIVGSEILHSPCDIHEIAVHIVEKCGGQLLAIILMGKSLKDEKDVQIWELALQKLRNVDREAIVNAFFNVIWENVDSESKKILLIRCLMVFRFQDLMMSDDQLFARWFSEKLVDTEEEAKRILQNFVECCVLLQFEGPLGRYILLPEDIKIILHALRGEIPDNLSEETSASTFSNHRVLKLSNTHMRNLYAASTLPQLKELNLEGCMLETLPEAVFKVQKLESLSLEHCSQLLELSQQITNLENLKELRLAGCERLEKLPHEIWELHKLEILSLGQCWRLSGLPQEIAKLQNLKELRLAGCEQLEALPQEIWELHKLETLSLEQCRQLLELSSDIDKLKNLKELRLAGCKRLMTLPQNIRELQKLETLTVEHCSQLQELPPQISELENLRELSVLNLSSTGIHELPSSIFNLQELKEFYLKDCKLLRELPSEISRLRNLTTLDLDGTLITHLPKEIQWLSNLESLSLSFYDDTVREVKSFISLTDTNHDSNFEVIPVGVLPQLTNLKVLKIGVNSDNEWWLKNFESVLVQISTLRMLRVLDVYIPRDNFRAPVKKCLSNFRFTVGHHKPRMISRVPPAIEAMFKESSRSLKFVNGQDFPDRVETILSESWAFFLDRHMTIKNLTQFRLKNLKQLRLCILAECNEMHNVLDVKEYEADSDVDESFCMQFLTVFYMKNLRTIINNPIHGNSIFCELKLLALHTCPELTTIFTMHFLHNLVNLEELIVEDCPKVSCIISCPSSEPTTEYFLPRLRKLSLLFVPELASISNGVRIGRNLEQMGLYYCPKLQSLSTAELSSEQLKKIRGETKWWEKLKWSEAEWGQKDPPHQFNNIFSPIDEDLDILTQLTTYEQMTSLNKKKRLRRARIFQ